MHFTRKEKVEKPIINPNGEYVYELIGCAESLGNAIKHSVAYVLMKPNSSSLLHFHPEAEESYYILKGEGKLFINDVEYNVKAGDVFLIQPSEKHQITAVGNENLEFLAICAPAWEPSNSIFLDENKF